MRRVLQDGGDCRWVLRKLRLPHLLGVIPIACYCQGFRLKLMSLLQQWLFYFGVKWCGTTYSIQPKALIAVWGRRGA